MKSERMPAMPLVYNINQDNIPDPKVYIGRGSPYGNPFKRGIDGTKTEVIDKYIDYVESNKELKKKFQKELRGKNLVCFCKPKPCHGDYLLSISNIDESIEFD